MNIKEFSQKAIIKTPSSSAITLSDYLRDLLGSDTKTFQQGTTTTLAKPCDILNGLHYAILCNEINREINLRANTNTGGNAPDATLCVGTNILGLLDIKSFQFIGGTQFHDSDEFTTKELMNTMFYNSLSFLLVGNNLKPFGEAFVELILT